MKKSNVMVIGVCFQILLFINRTILSEAFSCMSNEIGKLTPLQKRIRCRRRSNRCGRRRSSFLKLHDSKEKLQEVEELHPIGLYVHIPYCRQRCRYCNFSIVPIGNRVSTDPFSASMEAAKIYSEFDMRATQGFEAMNHQYEEALLTELRRISGSISHSANGKIPLQSIYFGGGTPSLAPVETIAKILENSLGEDAPFFLVDGRKGCSDKKSNNTAEITIEMDPGTFTTEKLEKLKVLGFNRISLGVQSFDDAILENMGRFHREADVFTAVEMIKKVFGDEANYSIDLMTGVPGLTLAKWAETLQIATTQLSPQPSHMSVYDLQIEQGTVFSSWYQHQEVRPPGSSTNKSKRLRLPTEDETAKMYTYTSGYLKFKEFEHYEVSSYAFRGANHGEGKRSKHNQIYWAPSSSWYAIGVGATSFADGRLVARPRTLAEYYQWLLDTEEFVDDKDGDELLSEHELLTELVMKRLRTIDGLDLKGVEDRFGKERASTILEGATLSLDIGLAEYDSRMRILRLKDPEGLLFSNSIISSIFAAL